MPKANNHEAKLVTEYLKRLAKKEFTGKVTIDMHKGKICHTVKAEINDYLFEILGSKQCLNYARQ